MNRCKDYTFKNWSIQQDDARAMRINLCKSFKNEYLHSLKYCSQSGNDLGPDGFEAVAGALENMVNMRRLHLVGGPPAGKGRRA
ncbi:MAG: hypothetical protein ACKO96_04765 [Flammeovirgaceae bacterium]